PQSQYDPLPVPLLNPAAILEKTSGNQHLLSCLSNPRHIVFAPVACCTPGQIIEKLGKIF
ncbi:hypothetical protein, partial [Mesorhizobium sp.]|uniref:hypothetical protein n=1 Tax=Mesorhizobium sp. TaxID=1871066 RepID=UPI00257E6209